MYNCIMTKNDNHKDGATPAEGVAVILENQVAGEKNQVRRHRWSNLIISALVLFIILDHFYDKQNLEREQKQKYALRKEIDDPARKTDMMMNEAYSTIALNIPPINLRKYLGLANDKQWTDYAQMAAERDAHNVVSTIESIDELMAIPAVAEIVENYNEYFTLSRKLKEKLARK